VWVAWTIFNPHGPTLCCLGASTSPKSRPFSRRPSHEVFFRWMHFLGGRSYSLGTLPDRSEDQGKALLEILLQGIQTAMPSGQPFSWIVNAIPSCVSVSDMPDEQKLVMRDLFKQAPVVRNVDWGREFHQLSTYKMDLFARAGAEAREAYEKLSRNPEYLTGAGAEYVKAIWVRRRPPAFSSVGH
jgi:hypothetical protein